MNSLNIVSRFTSTPPATPPRSRTSSSDDIGAELAQDASAHGPALDYGMLSEKLGFVHEEAEATADRVKQEDDGDDKTHLLSNVSTDPSAFKDAPGSRLWSLPRRISHAILDGVNVVFTTLTAPGRYIIACFYDDAGHFSAIMPLRNFKHLLSRARRKPTGQALTSAGAGESAHENQRMRRSSAKRSPSVDSNASSSSAATSEEGEEERNDDSPARHTRSKTATAQAAAIAATSAEEPTTQKRSIKIKAHNEEVRKRRAEKAKRQQSASPEHVAALANSLKSPSSPTSNTKMTRYPRAPVPPRPLVPRRQPSFTLSYSPTASRKTLIIDLDETLIHSMAKGGRMSTGHMVEVRLGGPVQTPVPTSPGGATQAPVSLGPGVPILYYVHERPNCHEFLRKVAKWYNLVAFTASVQEYADPVIDWLERERRYFSGRYYRQHCTFRNGAYIKDLAQVEPDLSRVMILDNSPMSYLFHDDNAIPIEGWISDPTDTDLLHLVPLLEALQYVTDVRALLALRKGQAQQA